jgi:hypothetical protein
LRRNTLAYTARKEEITMRKIVAAIAVVLFGLNFAAHAVEGAHNRYKWRDAQGNLHFDDALPIEALQFGYDVVNAAGIVVKHVPRTKTAEETKADEEAAAKIAAEKHAVDELAKADAQTLAAYPTENELIGSQQAQISMLDQNIHATEVSLQSQEKSLTEMLSHAADLDRTGNAVPKTLQSQIDSLRRNVEQQKNYIATKTKEKEQAAKRFEVELAHYRELRAKSGAH